MDTDEESNYNTARSRVPGERQRSLQSTFKCVKILNVKLNIKKLPQSLIPKLSHIGKREVIVMPGWTFSRTLEAIPVLEF